MAYEMGFYELVTTGGEKTRIELGNNILAVRQKLAKEDGEFFLVSRDGRKKLLARVKEGIVVEADYDDTFFKKGDRLEPDGCWVAYSGATGDWIRWDLTGNIREVLVKQQPEPPRKTRKTKIERDSQGKWCVQVWFE